MHCYGTTIILQSGARLSQLRSTVPLIVPKFTTRLFNIYLTKSLNETDYLRRTSGRKPSRYKVEVEPLEMGVQLFLAHNHLTSSTKMTKLYAVKGRKNLLMLEKQTKPNRTNNKNQRKIHQRKISVDWKWMFSAQVEGRVEPPKPEVQLALALQYLFLSACTCSALHTEQCSLGCLDGMLACLHMLS